MFLFFSIITCLILKFPFRSFRNINEPAPQRQRPETWCPIVGLLMFLERYSTHMILQPNNQRKCYICIQCHGGMYFLGMSGTWNSLENALRKSLHNIAVNRENAVPWCTASSHSVFVWINYMVFNKHRSQQWFKITCVCFERIMRRKCKK